MDPRRACSSSRRRLSGKGHEPAVVLRPGGPDLAPQGVLYGPAVFIALVARPALRWVDDARLPQVLGHLPAVANARLPLVRATALPRTSRLCGVVGGIHFTGMGSGG